MSAEKFPKRQVIRNHWKVILLPLFALSLLGMDQPGSNLDELFTEASQISQSDPDSANALYKNIYQVAIEQDSLSRSGFALYQIGLNFMGIGEFDSSIYYLNAAGKIFQDIEDHKGLTLINVSLGNIDNFKGSIENSIQFYHLALDHARINQDTFSQARILNNLGAAYNSAGRIQQALLTLNQGLQLAKQLDNQVLLGDIHNNFATNHEALKSFDSAFYFGKKAAEYYKLAGDQEYEALALTNLTSYLLAKDTINNDTIQAFLREGKAILDSINSPSILTNYYRQLTHYFYRTGNYDKARAAADSCLQLLDQFPNLHGAAQIYERLYRIYKAEGDIENALLYHEKFFTVRDSLVFAESNHQLQELEARYQLAAKDARLVNQELEISERTYQRNFYLTLALAFLALVAFLIYRHRQKEIIMKDQVALQKEQITNLKNQQQIVALDHLLQGQEEERRRIAQDLHDGLGGLLSTVQVLMQKVTTRKQDHQEHHQLLIQSNDMVSDACQEVRRIAHDMMPGALINIGLIAAVSDLLDTYAENTDISFYFEAPEEEFEISDRQSIGIYRIVQEILNNTIKYAQCSVFKLSIRQESDLMLIDTEDNGVGFNQEDPLMTSGLGIRGIKSRVDHLGGTCILTTQPGKGVKYEIQIPILN